MGSRPKVVAALLGLLATIGVVYALIAETSPESRVAAYLEATSRGDERAALAAWQTWPCCIPRPELEARRTDLTRELTTLRVGQRSTIRFIEWWRTCCEPGIIDDPKNAGRARIFVGTTDRAGLDRELVFEVWAKDGTWWGDAGGQAHHDWTIRDVYPRGQRPAGLGGPVAPLTREDAIRSTRSLASIGGETRFEVKRSTLRDLKTELGPQDFTPGADPDRSIWVVAAIGSVGRGISQPAALWAVFALDVDEHIVLGVQFGDVGERPLYFDRLPEH